MTPQAHLRRRYAAASAAALVLAGCSYTITGQPTDAAGTIISTSPYEEPTVRTPLADRPGSATVSATYDQMQISIRVAVTAVVPSLNWVPRDKPGSAICSDGPTDQEGRLQALQTWGANGPIPDEQWPAVVAAVEAAVASYGFGELVAIVDRPGDHLAESVGPYGATVQIGTGKNVILTTITGCHPE